MDKYGKELSTNQKQLTSVLLYITNKNIFGKNEMRCRVDDLIVMQVDKSMKMKALKC